MRANILPSLLLALAIAALAAFNVFLEVQVQQVSVEVSTDIVEVTETVAPTDDAEPVAEPSV